MPRSNPTFPGIRVYGAYQPWPGFSACGDAQGGVRAPSADDAHTCALQHIIPVSPMPMGGRSPLLRPVSPGAVARECRGQQAGLRGTSGIRMRARCSRCVCSPPLVRALHLCPLCRGRFSGLDLCYSESCLPTMASQNNWAECGLDDTCVSTDGASVGDTVAGYGTWDAGESDGFSHWFRSTPTAPDGIAANIMSFPSGRLGTYTVNP